MSKALVGYETTFIMKAEVADDVQKEFIEKLKGIIELHGGAVLVTEDWGRRKLAYPIQKETRGSYTHMVFAGDNKVVAELERNMRINETVIRFLSVKLGHDFNSAEYKHRPSQRPPVERPAYDRPYGERSFGDRGDRSFGDRPAFNRDERPSFNRDRDDRGDRNPSDAG